MRKSLIIILITNIVLVLFQTSFFNILFGDYSPNLIMAFAFAVVFTLKGEYKYLSGFIGGLFFDLLTFNIIGLTSVILILTMIMSYIIKKFFISRTYMNIVLVFISSIIFDFIIVSGTLFNVELLVRALLTSIVSIIMYFFIYTLSKRVNKDSYFLNL